MKSVQERGLGRVGEASERARRLNLSRASIATFALLLGSACGSDDVSPDSGTDTSVDGGSDATTDIGDTAIPDDPRFDPGPYGSEPRDLTGPFTLSTTTGEFDFEEVFDGESHFIVVLFAEGLAYSEQLFESRLDYLLEDSPANTHFIFGGIAGGTSDAISALEASFETLVEERPEFAAWRERLHFVPDPIGEAEGALGDYLRSVRAPVFGIDRNQRWRNVGLLSWPLTPGSSPQFSLLALEASHWEFEHGRQERLDALDAEHGVMEVPIFVGAEAAGSVTGTATLPADDVLQGFDTLEIDLTNSCIGHRVENCWEWDRIGTLRLCHESEGELICDVEIARMITTYHREGRWVTDISHALALLRGGEELTFRWDGGPVPEGHPYIVDLSFRFSQRGKADRAFEAIPVFTGGRFDENYNAMQTPVDFEMPEGARRVELVSMITGHGFGAEAANCAEFCPHSHHFFVGDEEWVDENPRAGERRGCVEQVVDGVVPNQFGTWPLGRAGWCPGLDVPPFVADLTPALSPGMNTLRYEARLGGVEYVPEVTEPDGFRAQLDLSAWLVFYR